MSEPSIKDVERLATAIQRELGNMARDGELTHLASTWGSDGRDRALIVTIETSGEVNLVSLAHRLLKAGAV